jgi:DNA-binding CsgD family transcriptional regulator
MHTLIGDVIGSRAITDRAAAQSLIGRVLSEVSTLLTPLQPLEPTVGDEFQGAFATVADATLAALLIRLGLLPGIDVRCGLGTGEVSVHDASRAPLLQDGPGWWAAREALVELATPRRSGARTWYVGPEAGRVNPFLLTRDALVDRLSERGCRMLRMSLLGESQQAIAKAEGISKSAVSQQFSRGISAVRDAQLLFGKVE